MTTGKKNDHSNQVTYLTYLTKNNITHCQQTVFRRNWFAMCSFKNQILIKKKKIQNLFTWKSRTNSLYACFWLFNNHYNWPNAPYTIYLTDTNALFNGQLCSFAIIWHWNCFVRKTITYCDFRETKLLANIITTPKWKC